MRKLLILVGIFLAFAMGYGAVSMAYPGGGMYGRGEYRGYFRDIFDTSGTFVLPNNYGGEAFPSWVNNANAFIGFLEGGAGLGGNAQQRTGASFLVQTMIGSSRNRPPTAAELAEWEGRVRYAESQGRITWRTNYCRTINSFYQGPRGGGYPDDDAFYDESGCNAAIIFRNASGGVAYAIQWICANPVGVVGPLPDDLNWTASGWSTVSNASPRPGDTITFNHYVRNNGPTSTGSMNIWSATWDHPSNVILTPGHNTGVYAAGQVKLVDTRNRLVPLGTPPGTQICEKVIYDWAQSWGPGYGVGPPACATVRYDFTLIPTINIRINGGAVPGVVAQPGDSVDFVYAVNNPGTTASQTTNCDIYGLTRNGYYAIPSPRDSTSDAGFVEPSHGCPRTFPYGTNTTLVTESIVISSADINKSICRSLFVSPASASGGTASDEVCVRVAARPYLKIYGGDVSAGNGQTTIPGSCTSNLDAAIIGWNRGSANGYGAASVEFAALALNRIYDLATAKTSLSGPVPPPSALAFANTSVSGSTFGGSYGSLPCIADYYDTTGTTPLPSNNVSLLGGVHRYSATGSVTLSGNINPNQRTVIYVQGDVLITGNIIFPGAWNMASMPLLQLVVRGNIFVSQNVTQLDGVYIAQQNGAAGGTIYTCANPGLPATAATTTSGALYLPCRNKLTVNGAFVAKQIRFLRTGGTMQAATSGEANTSANIAEVFNFSPAVWMVQPPTVSGTSGEYDAITSLPPVL